MSSAAAAEPRSPRGAARAVKARLGAGGLTPGMIVAGKFALVRLIAQGDLAQVFEAEDTLVERRVALKVLLPEPAAEADVVRRFRREAHATAIISHPNVVTVLEVGRRSDGGLYIVEELLTGPTLEEHKKAHEVLSEEQAIRIVAPIAGALATAHALGIVHRDVKPANVILATTSYSEMVPKLIDFGVARVQTARGASKTMVGTLLGTAQYMSPEQASGEPGVDGRTDVWALGVVLFELLTGRCPFEGPNDHAVLAKVLSDDVPRIEGFDPGIRKDLAKLIHSALERDVNRRPAMRVMFQELSAMLAAGPRPEGDTVLEPAAPRVSQLEAIAPTDVEYVEAEPDDTVVGEEEPEALGEEDIEVLHDGSPQTDADAADRYADAAQDALRVNALEEAVRQAELGVASASGELLGQLRLVQAIAHYWLGRYARAEDCAQFAMNALPQSTTGWFAALGHLAMARSRSGKIERLPEEAIVLEGAKGSSRLGAGHIVAVCRLAVTMTHAGSLVAARQIVRSIRDRMDRQADEAVVYAWLDVAFAERAAFVGDLARELSRRTSALERFTAAGDLRNACQERAHLGAAYLRVGAFEDALRVLHEALGIAEPMKLGVVGQIKAYLGRTALRMHDAPKARGLVNEALGWATVHGDRRVEALSRVYLAEVCAFMHDDARAFTEADAAARMSGAFPALRAHALGVCSATLLSSNRADRALEPARQAVALLNSHGGAGEAESIIRLAHALALSAAGEVDESHQRLRDARVRLFGLAERLADPRHKRWFLERIHENASILELGRDREEPPRA